MAISKAECYVVTCDACKEPLDGGDFMPHYDSEKQAREFIPEYDWHIEGDIVKCNYRYLPSPEEGECEFCGETDACKCADGDT